MKMDKINENLKTKGVSQLMIEFLEACLRENESVYIEKEGKNVEDPQKSRLSWEEVYLHPIFKG